MVIISDTDWNSKYPQSNPKIILNQSPDLGRSRTFPVSKKDDKVVKSILSHQFRGETVEYPPIGKVILDKQIVDTFGKKVVRVNDLTMVKINNDLKITHASIGTRSLLRRIGLLKIAFYQKIVLSDV